MADGAFGTRHFVHSHKNPKTKKIFGRRGIGLVAPIMQKVVANQLCTQCDRPSGLPVAPTLDAPERSAAPAPAQSRCPQVWLYKTAQTDCWHCSIRAHCRELR